MPAVVQFEFFFTTWSHSAQYKIDTYRVLCDNLYVLCVYAVPFFQN